MHVSNLNFDNHMSWLLCVQLFEVRCSCFVDLLILMEFVIIIFHNKSAIL